MSKYADDVVRIPCSLESFFSYWVEVLKPFHKLTNRESEILAAFLSRRYDLSKSISDEDLLDAMLMSDETKADVREMTGLGIPSLYAILKTFEKRKVTINGKINKRFIPKLSDDKDNYKMMFFFEIK